MSRMQRTAERREWPHAATIAVAAGAAALVLVACGAMAGKKDLPPLAVVDKVDLERFMGAWHVISSIPTSLEKDAVDATDTYRLDSDGTVDILFTYRDTASGPLKELRSRGFVQAPSNAIWGVQFVWPLKADYRVAWLADDYSAVVVAREKRDHVWIMSRAKTMPEAQLRKLVDFVAAQGYDVTKLRRVPQAG